MPEPREPQPRHLLSLVPVHARGRRSAETCLYRCGNACAHEPANPTDNPYFGDVVAAAVSRRTLLKALGLSTLAAAAGGTLAARPVAADLAPLPGSALTFEPVPPNFLDDVVVPGNGYRSRPVIRWGDPILSGAPAFDPLDQTAAKQAGQFGYNCDYVAVVPVDDTGDTALLVVNHEYTNEELMFPGVRNAAGTTAEQKRIAMMAHGLSVVEIERISDSGAWRRAARRSRYNRRVTVATPMEMTGPAAGSEHLRTNADPTGRLAYGTFNNCAGGTTPWGTTLHGEENVNQYFGSSSPVADHPDRRMARYSLNRTGPSGRRWETIDPRFDIAKEPNEPNRFGWIVELDPFDRTSTPRKRTALGRFSHEGANVRIAEDGRVVAYTGDDAQFEYIYKFVSKGVYDGTGTESARRHNMTLLEDGDLYVARFAGDSPPAEITGTGTLPSDGEFDGSGSWVPLVQGGQSMIPGKSVAWVLTFTRLAVDRLGKKLDPVTGDYVDANGSPLPANATPIVVDPSKVATRMDRPEDIEPNPVNGRVYAALTNNTSRTTGPDEANPITRSWSYATNGTYALRNGNRNGHVIEWEETGVASGTTFSWRIFLIAGDPTKPETYFAGFDKSQVSPISCPDNVAFDPAGNLWIATDGNVLSVVNAAEGTASASNDGIFAVPVSGPERGNVKQFLTVPKGAEACGPLISWDARSLFFAVQHPGELSGSTFDTPASTWPDHNPTRGYPRPSVAVAYRIHSDRRVGG